ncbi:MAG TPA: hypothetical protein PKW04_11840, partial [Novosphingobium sp.]|nr:hypothetical protein [Novosphingobium sp.]
MIEPSWMLMAAVIGGILVLNGIATLTLPTPVAAVCALLAILITGATPLAVRIEQDRLHTPAQRAVLLGAVVGLPMLLLGLAILVSLGQVVLMIVRGGVLVILAGTWPLSASAAALDAG